MQEYFDLLGVIKNKIREARTAAVLSVNKELIGLYWQIGDLILKRQDAEGWGAKIIEKLSCDLKQEFPEMKGFSKRNLLFMRAFAVRFSDFAIVKQLVSLLHWGHIIRIMQTKKEYNEQMWYIEECIKNGWSRNILVIKTNDRKWCQTRKVSAKAISKYF